MVAVTPWRCSRPAGGALGAGALGYACVRKEAGSSPGRCGLAGEPGWRGAGSHRPPSPLKSCARPAAVAFAWPGHDLTQALVMIAAVVTLPLLAPLSQLLPKRAVVDACSA